MKGLMEADVVVAVAFFYGRETMVERSLDESEIQALASATGVTHSLDIAVVGEQPVGPSRDPSWVEFNWGERLLHREDGVDQV